MAVTVFRPGDRPLLHLGLLGATALSTFAAFRWQGFGEVRASLIFSFCLLLILGAHEMGHYLLARIHGVNTSLPYFIPFPIGIGTLGAVIRIRDRIPNRNALVDIGAAGPLAGLAVALPILIYGLLHSPPTDPIPPGLGWMGESSLWGVAQHLLHRQPLSASGPSVIMFGDSVLTLALKRFLIGPLPPGLDIHEHPAYLAAWFGLVVTMLNLIPIGQLDGGHLTAALFGRRAETLGKVAAFVMLLLCVFASASWVLWLGLSAGVVGFRHPPVVEEAVRLTPGRRWACALCALGLVLCVIPIPITAIGR
jgi:membrane-associated protease RseP (regulator of RpoE activity)